ncbi:MAG: c-type cytochrome [Flavobacterium sp.]|nr:c-type cytochrome [Candidatus Neoflavobacterium equi]
MKKVLGILAIIIAPILLTSALSRPIASDYEIVDGNFKNLKVLPQDISKDSLMGLMQQYNRALGVKCNYCHVQDKAADDNHNKDIARHMIKFTNDLNSKEFNPLGKHYENSVSCAMCHRGDTKPITGVKYFEENMKQKK